MLLPMFGMSKMDHVFEALRAMAWERAKGELRSISQIGPAFFCEKDGIVMENVRSKEFMKLVDDFIEAVEDEELYSYK